jgi:predicted nucleotidyltransferase
MPAMGIQIHAESTPPRHHEHTPPGYDTPSSLADALFTATQQRVLSLLFGHPERSFYANQLIKLSGSGSGAVQRELTRLASSGLVTVQRVGNQKHYQANAESPIFDELCGLVLKTVALTAPIRRALEPLADRIELALLYGTSVKGTDTASSDVYLLVVAEDLSLEELYAVLAPIESALQRELSPSLYTRQEFERRKDDPDSPVSRLLAGEHRVVIGSYEG